MILLTDSISGKQNGTSMERMEEESALLFTVVDEICVTRSSGMGKYVMVYHKPSDIDQDTEVILSIVYISQTDVHQSSTRSCHQVSPGDYWVAVFDLDDAGRMKEYPTRVTMLHVNGKLSNI